MLVIGGAGGIRDRDDVVFTHEGAMEFTLGGVS